MFSWNEKRLFSGDFSVNCLPIRDRTLPPPVLVTFDFGVSLVLRSRRAGATNGLLDALGAGRGICILFDRVTLKWGVLWALLGLLKLLDISEHFFPTGGFFVSQRV